MLQINQLAVDVEGKHILNGIDLTVNPGEVVAVMGKNGSGKSSMAYTLMGHPKYEVTDGTMELDGKKLNELSPDKRANLGLFLANQYPVAVPGLLSNSFLWQVYKKHNSGKTIANVVEFRKWMQGQAEMLDLKPELLARGLNDGFSGGEKKKLEILQLLVANPRYIILDEIDSGLDVDALKRIAQTVAKAAKTMNIGVVAITHYQRILNYLKPDKVVILDSGKIIKSGEASLALEIESQGYNR